MISNSLLNSLLNSLSNSLFQPRMCIHRSHIHDDTTKTTTTTTNKKTPVNATVYTVVRIIGTRMAIFFKVILSPVFF